MKKYIKKILVIVPAVILIVLVETFGTKAALLMALTVLTITIYKKRTEIKDQIETAFIFADAQKSKTPGGESDGPSSKGSLKTRKSPKKLQRTGHS